MRSRTRSLISFALTGLLWAPGSLAADLTSDRPLAILQLKVIEGEGAVHEAGSRAARPLVVQVTDETGRPVEGVAVSLRMPADGPTGWFGEDMSTEVLVTGPDGRVAAWGILWGRQPGSVRVRITAAKGDVRAGTVSEQYISPRSKTAEKGEEPRAPSVSKPRGKWIAIALVAAGAAAGGLVLGLSGKSASTPAALAGGTTTPKVQVGAPTITIGAP